MITDLLAPGAIGVHFVEQQRPVDAVATPFPSWNRHCRDDGGGKGLARGWYVTIGANTGHGKSLLGINLSAHAIRSGESVGYASAEMSCAQLATRFYAILTGATVRAIERGASFDPSVMRTVTAELERVRAESGGSFLTNAGPVCRVDEVLELMGELYDRGCRYFVVDYLQLLAARNSEKLFTAVSDASARVREFARTHNVVVVALSQFNRTTSANYSDRPTIQGLMGASSIENDSDQVALLDHTRSEEIAPGRKRTHILLAKNRHGSVGEIPIQWDYSTLRVREFTKGDV